MNWWTPEQQKSQKAFILKMRELTEEVKKDPSKGLKLLVRAGIYDKNGKLTKEFGGKS